MDKYEYRVKAEQIRKLIEQEDYATAVKIANNIDWNRVKSVPMLCLIGEIYQKNGMLEESRDVMLIAYDRHPYGKMIIYSLAELSIELQEFVDAVEYYKEFVQVAPRDTGRYILQYKLYAAQGVGVEERIQVLEEFKKHEHVEKWSFELAYLYHLAGRVQECVDECDELILWFSEGEYVEKAMELKMIHQPLTAEQQIKYNNRNSVEIENSIKAVEKIAEQGPSIEEEIQIKPVNIGIYDTVNLQEELAKSMKQIMEATEKETIDSTMQNIRKMVKDSQLEGILPEEAAGETRVFSEVPKTENPFGQNPQPENILEADVRLQQTQKQPLQRPEEEEAPLIAGQAELLSPEEAEQESGRTQEVSIPEGAEVLNKSQDKPAVSEQEPENNSEAMPEETGGKLEISGKKPAQETGEIPESIRKILTGEAGKVPENIRKALAEEARQILEREMSSEPEAKEAVPPVQPISAEDAPAYLPEANTEEIQAVEIEAALQTEAMFEEMLHQVEAQEEIVNEPPAQPVSEPLEEPELSLEDLKVDYTHAPTKRIPVREIQRAIPDSEPPEDEQIPGQMTLEEALAEWNKILAEARQRKENENLEAAKQRALKQAENILSRLADSAPKPAMKPKTVSITPVPAHPFVSQAVVTAAKQELAARPKQQELSSAAEEEPELDELDSYGKEEEPEDEDAAEDLEAKLEASLPEGIDSFVEKEEPVYMPPKELPEEYKKVFAYFVEFSGVSEQLSRVIDLIEDIPDKGNVAIMGDAATGKTTLAIDLVKVIQKQKNLKSGKIAKISGESMNHKNIEAMIKKIGGGVLIIEEAGLLSDESCMRISDALEQESKEMLIILEDTKEAVMDMFEANPVFAEKFPGRVVLPSYSNNDLVAFGKSYAQEMEYTIDEMGVLALYQRLSEIEMDDYNPTLVDVKDIIDEAIRKSSKKSVKNLMNTVLRKKYSEEGYIILQEKDFLD